MPTDPSEVLSVDDDALVRPYMFILWVLWGALLASVGIYVVLGHFLLPAGPPVTGAMPMVYALAGVAVAIAVTVPIVRARLLPPTAESGGPTTIRRDAADRATAPYLVAQTISLALCDAIAVFGLVATMSLREPRYVLYFGAAAALGMLALRPSAERVRGTLRAALLHPPSA